MNIDEKISAYRQKFYINQLLRGLLITFSIALSVYVSLNFLEYIGRFNSIIRALFFFSFVGGVSAVVIWGILNPLSKLFQVQKPLSDEQVAKNVGQYFPNIDDKLVNTLQLRQIASHNALAQASLTQRTQEFSHLTFTEAVHYDENRKYLRFIFVPLLIIGGVFLASPSLFGELFGGSTKRIINFNESFAEPAPFTFELQNKTLKAFKNEDFMLEIALKGRAIPQEMFLKQGEKSYKIVRNEKGIFTYLFPKMQKNVNFSLESAGFSSKNYNIELLERPTLLAFDAQLIYPVYLGKQNENWQNIGNLIVPEGTQIKWQFKTSKAEKMRILFGEKPDTFQVKTDTEDKFIFEKQARNSQNYQIQLQNIHSANKEEINYNLQVIADKYPTIQMQAVQDTATFQQISVGGNIQDDYGISGLQFVYRVNKNGKTGAYQTINIPFSTAQTLQDFFYQFDLAQLNLQPNDQVEYFTQVSDNDGVNGAKTTKTTGFQFKVPSNRDFDKDVAKATKSTESQMDKTLQKAKNLQTKLDNLENKLRNKEKMDFQDKKLAEEIQKERQELAEEVKKLQEQNQNLQDKQNRFQEQDQQIAEKMEQLQKLMNELLDPETKKLYDELQKLLEKNRDNDAIINKLDEIKEKEGNLEKELERAMEMFKQMQFEQNFQKTIDDLEKLSKEQEQLGEKSERLEQKEQKTKEEKSQLSPTEKQEQKDIKEEQKKLEQKFEDVKKQIDDLQKQDKELKNQNELNKNENEIEKKQNEIDQKQDESQKAIDENEKKNDENKKDENQENQENKENKEGENKDDKENNKENKDSKKKKDKKEKASKPQKDAAKKMKELADKMQDIKDDDEKDQDAENADDLRAILENLIRLSYNQEELMKEFKEVNLSDPRFIKLAQQQLKLQDDSRIIEDSLIALSKRVFEIESFVTRELGQMKKYMNESTNTIKQRRIGQTTGKQQMAMTSMNNLALMLAESLKNMQDKANDIPMKGKGKKSKKGKGKGKGKGDGKGDGKSSPNISKMQKKLNEQIQELQKSGKSGRQLSEELAKLAAEQQRIRKALKEMEKRQASQIGKEGKQGKDGQGKEGQKDGQGQQGKDGKQGQNGQGGQNGQNGNGDQMGQKGENGNKNPEGDKEGELKRSQFLKEIKDLQKELERNEDDLVNKRLMQLSQSRMKNIETRMLESEKAQKEQDEEQTRKAEQAKEYNKVIPPALKQFFNTKNKQTELLRTIPPALSPYYKKEVDKYFEKIQN